MIKKRTLILTYLVLFTFPVLAENNYFEVGKATLADLIQIKSTESAGLATRASEYASEKLRSAGFDQDDLKIVGPTSDRKSVV